MSGSWGELINMGWIHNTVKHTINTCITYWHVATEILRHFCNTRKKPFTSWTHCNAWTCCHRNVLLWRHLFDTWNVMDKAHLRVARLDCHSPIADSRDTSDKLDFPQNTRGLSSAVFTLSQLQQGLTRSRWGCSLSPSSVCSFSLARSHRSVHLCRYLLLSSVSPPPPPHSLPQPVSISSCRPPIFTPFSADLLFLISLLF